MVEKTKYDIMCVERGDIDYLRSIAQMLLSNDPQLHDQMGNIAKALDGIANAAYELGRGGY